MRGKPTKCHRKMHFLMYQFALLFLMRDMASKTCLMGVFLVVVVEASAAAIFFFLLMGE